MEISVYIWYTDVGEKSVGHSALRLYDGTYISWVPRDNKDKESIMNGDLTAVPGRANNYKDDVRLETHTRNQLVKIRCESLDEKQMKRKWSEFRADEQYDLAEKNCCDAVIDVLEAGGATNYVSIPNKPRYPKAVLDYAESLQWALEGEL